MQCLLGWSRHMVLLMIDWWRSRWESVLIKLSRLGATQYGDGRKGCNPISSPNLCFRQLCGGKPQINIWPQETEQIVQFNDNELRWNVSVSAVLHYWSTSILLFLEIHVSRSCKTQTLLQNKWSTDFDLLPSFTQNEECIVTMSLKVHSLCHLLNFGLHVFISLGWT